MEKEEPMRLIVIALLTTIFLAGCSSNPPRQIEISARPIDKPNLILPDATQLRLKDLEWVIITKANAEEVFAKLVKDKNDPVLIGLTDDGYEILSLNHSDIMAYIQQQNAIIKAYRNYYEESEQALEEANANLEGAKQQVQVQQDLINSEESTLERFNPFK